MELQEFRDFFMWCTIINVVLIFFVFLIFVFNIIPFLALSIIA